MQFETAAGLKQYVESWKGVLLFFFCSKILLTSFLCFFKLGRLILNLSFLLAAVQALTRHWIKNWQFPVWGFSLNLWNLVTSPWPGFQSHRVMSLSVLACLKNSWHLVIWKHHLSISGKFRTLPNSELFLKETMIHHWQMVFTVWNIHQG